MKRQLLILVACVFGAYTALAQIPTNGLVAAYNFTDSQNFLSDESGNDYTLCATGAPVIDISNNSSHPVGDSAVYFNGTNKLSYCGGVGNDFLSGSVSISAWFKLSQFAPYNTIACIRYNDASLPYNAVNLFTGSAVGGNIAFSFSTMTQTDIIVEGTTVINYGQWYHAVATFNELTGEAQLYLNGVLEGAIVAGNEGIIYSNDALTIGNVPAGTPQDMSNAFVGHIDEVLYYNRAITAEEVCEIYTGADCSSAVPAAPTNLSASISGSTVALVWTDNSSDETGFRLERSTDGVNYITAANISANTSAQYDYPGNGVFYYRVFAYNATGDSDPSNVIVVTVGNAELTETLNAALNVHPNPSKESVTISLQEPMENVTISVIDLIGNEVFVQHYDKLSEEMITLNGVSGAYLMKLTTADGNYVVRKLIKE